MKTTIEINGKPVEIELTKDQIEKIKKHTEKITGRLKTWEDACEIKGIHPIKSLPYPNESNDFEKAINGVAQMFIIVDLLCEGWVADWSDTSQYKYMPYFKYNESGFGFSYSRTYTWYADATIGSRLVFPTTALAEYAGKQFITIYNKFLTK